MDTRWRWKAEKRKRKQKMKGLRVMDGFTVMIVVTASMYTQVKMYKSVHFKHMQIIISITPLYSFKICVSI